MMTNQQYDDWCRRLKLSEKARQMIDRIRASAPSRRLRSGARNISGRYPSRKMGHTIQFASHTLTYPAVLSMEYDPTVLEFYDQPDPIKLTYQHDIGRPVTFMDNPDYFVLREDSAGWESWEDEQVLVTRSQERPHRYQRRDDGCWQSPPGEQFASAYGLRYHLHSSAELNGVFFRNLKLLEDYFREDCPTVESSEAKALCDLVATQPGLTLQELLDKEQGVRSDDLYVLIAQGDLYVNLEAAPLANLELVRVFVDAHTAEAYALSIQHQTRGFIHLTSTFTLTTGQHVTWDGKPWTILNVGLEYVTLLNEDQRWQPLQIATFDTLVKQGLIKGVPTDPPSCLSEEALARLKAASPADCELAAQHYRIIAPLLRGQPRLTDDRTPARTRRAWMRRFRLAEQCYGNGFIGLLPLRAQKGNRDPKIPEDAQELMRKHIETNYESLKQRRKTHSYRILQAECEKRAIHIPSFRTFCREIAARPRYEQTLKRQGRRVAYREAPRQFVYTLKFHTPRHGDRPFEICHLDHTQTDLELVDSLTRTNLGRAWATFLQDAYSRRLLAIYLTYDPPSYISAMMVLRICVMNHQRLPQILVVDGGKEFASTSFETLLGAYDITKKTRRPAQGRDGSVLDRLFGTANTELIYNLQGNTQIMRNVRQVTKEVNPKRQAVWPIGAFYQHLCEWADKVYDTTLHPALGQPPREAFIQGLARTGSRDHRRVFYNDMFRMFTLPTTRKGTAKVLPGEGVIINHLRYWAHEFRAPGVENSSVPVKYDPFDCSIAYAYVDNQWVLCRTGNYDKFRGRSVRELYIIAEEERKKARLVRQQYGKAIACRTEWFLKTEQTERVLLQQRRDAEHKHVLQIITGGSHQSPPPTQKPSALPPPPASPSQATSAGNMYEDEDLTFEAY